MSAERAAGPKSAGSGALPRARASGTYAVDELLEEDVDLSPDQQKEINDFFGQLRVVTLYELLGVARAADKRALRHAYYQRATEFHSDRFFRKRLGSYKRRMDVIFARITEAYELLSSPEKRAQYDAAMQANRNSLIEELLAEAMRETQDAAESWRREEVANLGDYVIDASSLDAPGERRPKAGDSLKPQVGRAFAQRLAGPEGAEKLRKIPPPLPPEKKR